MAIGNGRFWMTEEWSFAILRALSMLGGMVALFLVPVRPEQQHHLVPLAGLFVAYKALLFLAIWAWPARLRLILIGTTGLDLVFVSLFVWHTGGGESHFYLLFYLLVALAAAHFGPTDRPGDGRRRRVTICAGVSRCSDPSRGGPQGSEGAGRAPAIGRRETLQDWSPVQTFELLGGATPSGVKRMSSGAAIHPQPMRGWTDQDQWDAVAYLWSLGTTPDRVDVGRRLFSRNCAACHGERGSGDGPGGKSQPKWPADFTNARTMLAGTGSLYTAKIRRGGMGSGMPYWGNIFTEEELAALVGYLWTFSLNSQE